MDIPLASKTSALSFMRGTLKAIIYALAIIGLFWMIGGPVLRLLFLPLFETEIVRSALSPDRHATAEVEVRKGGFGTVWTTRVHLRSISNTESSWTVYQAKDSAFVPSLQWADRDTLIIGLPCERFDYVSNPDDWERSNPTERRIKVRFTYSKECPLPVI